MEIGPEAVTQGYVKSFAIWTRLDSLGAAADGNRFYGLEIAAVKDRDVAGLFIGDKNAIVGLGEAAMEPQN